MSDVKPTWSEELEYGGSKSPNIALSNIKKGDVMKQEVVWRWI